MTPRDDDDQALDLTLLAIQEQFLAEWRAGKRPRLSVYAARYPAYAAALADLVMRLEPDEQAASPEPIGERFLNGEGARRALEGLSGAAPADHQLPRVAEQPTSYDARDEARPPAQTPPDPPDD